MPQECRRTFRIARRARSPPHRSATAPSCVGRHDFRGCLAPHRCLRFLPCAGVRRRRSIQTHLGRVGTPSRDEPCALDRGERNATSQPCRRHAFCSRVSSSVSSRLRVQRLRSARRTRLWQVRGHRSTIADPSPFVARVARTSTVRDASEHIALQRSPCRQVEQQCPGRSGLADLAEPLRFIQSTRWIAGCNTEAQPRIRPLPRALDQRT